MKYKIKICIAMLQLVGMISYAQMNKYHFKRELQGTTDQWHKIVLPDDIYKNVSPQLSDIRIYGITAQADTIEVPYLLQVRREKVSNTAVDFKLINTVRNENGYYFTFSIPAAKTINEITLKFKQKNFDWHLNLAGSQDQREWFNIVESYRILSIQNETTAYQFTKVTFPASRFHFFRLFIASEEKPQLIDATTILSEVTPGQVRAYSIADEKRKENKRTGLTEIDIDLQNPVPVSYLAMAIDDTVDYYRPVTFKYLKDSFKTQQGWKYNYVNLSTGTISSAENNEFKFKSTVLQRLKILIQNNDNSPLSIDSLQVKGYVHELAGRFSQPASFYLTYHSSAPQPPNYDLNRFAERIPTALTALKLGEEQTIERQGIPVREPLFKNKLWMWVIMVAIIILLGWFSIKMMRRD